MRTPYTQLFLHCVWATWDRLPLITPALERPVYAAIRAGCDALHSPCLAIGGMPDHVHLLVRLHTTVSVAELLKSVKGASSHLITHQAQAGEFFKWQGAYGAFTVWKADVPVVKTHIENQRPHHTAEEVKDEWEQTATEEDEGEKEG